MRHYNVRLAIAENLGDSALFHQGKPVVHTENPAVEPIAVVVYCILTIILSNPCASNLVNDTTGSASDYRYFAFYSSNFTRNIPMLFKSSRTPFYFGSVLLLCTLNSSAFAGQTTQINVSSSGQPANPVDMEFYPQINADGRYVTFTSGASNLVSGDNNDAADIFVHDRLMHKTDRISVTPNGKQGNESSSYSSITADGRYVAFLSEASNLVADDKNNGVDVFVYDRWTKKTKRVSVNSDGTEVTGGIGDISGMFGLEAQSSVSISANGRYIAFKSNISLDDAGTLCDFCGGIFVHDQLAHKTTRISSGNNKSINAKSMSADGRYVAFASTAKKDELNNNYVFVYDRFTAKTEQVSVVLGGNPVSYVSWNDYALNANGNSVAFASSDPNRFVGSTNTKSEDVFVYNRLTHKTERISAASSNTRDYLHIATPSISADGRYVAFGSRSNNLVSDDISENPDIFVFDRQTHKTELASVDSNGVQSNGYFDIFDTSLSADGRHLVFTSDAQNLVTGITAHLENIFVRDRLLDATHHADLKLALTTKPTLLKPNTTGNYTYTVINNGPDTVNDVSLVYLVSEASSISFKPSQGRCSVATTETVCHLGKLAAGKKLTLSTVIKAPNSTAKSFSQQITVSGAPVDAVPANNQISVSTLMR
jgi:Domain of unknown function DUF11/WD40-like Beta Propeller Repeat